jgi:hypothetical protein
MPRPLCWKCRHFREDITCKPFPQGIPWQILTSKADHHQPYPGDQGIRFEPLEEVVPLGKQ